MAKVLTVTFLGLLLAGGALSLAMSSAAQADRHVEAERAPTHLDVRHGHNHNYLNRGVMVREVPHGALAIHLGPNRYWFAGGVWYSGFGHRFTVVPAPIGVFVPALPPFYVALTIGGIPYFYANETYFVWRDAQRGYEVVAPPGGAEDVPAAAGAAAVPPAPAAPSAGGVPAGPTAGVFAYPRNAQSLEQQANDRYECHRWAVTQTGFDPTQIPAVGPGGNGGERDAYLRAQAACLEARGYTVR